VAHFHIGVSVRVSYTLITSSNPCYSASFAEYSPLLGKMKYESV